ncbi:hypothetical protein BCR35DRAFT_332985 [Leucosporidium creatinivorum]|uniref:Uncharacterized protein n=1 Tax=Leucosporidium creatinivorum TaxID=106004 RepID=A0A1Y2EWM8_9BASI|nr:hypothetical protein BCR35DRAFT_332985 [Leucosporidium creatinivorum]
MIELELFDFKNGSARPASESCLDFGFYGLLRLKGTAAQTPPEPAAGSGNSTRRYSWAFDNSQVGDYNLKALVSLAIPVNGTCPEPADYQNSTLSFGWSFVAPSESNSGISGATTTTATFAQAPTGTYSATGTVGSTPTDTTTPASGGSRTVAGALAGLVVASLGMAVLA